ncbi:hypothetical protein J3R30DRAFT_3425224 [Lentinula aciculospora]|uniref:Uncharacterized protein n=1 Tax=Lentinula aciculospora TaxID=153920 RepID=A0A9W9AUQ2_9AGAR|nr:hypothetical protein J3R30DRAFT_3425224 [Lentinula aciculospora]
MFIFRWFLLLISTTLIGIDYANASPIAVESKSVIDTSQPSSNPLAPRKPASDKPVKYSHLLMNHVPIGYGYLDLKTATQRKNEEKPIHFHELVLPGIENKPYEEHLLQHLISDQWFVKNYAVCIVFASRKDVPTILSSNFNMVYNEASSTSNHIQAQNASDGDDTQSLLSTLNTARPTVNRRSYVSSLTDLRRPLLSTDNATSDFSLPLNEIEFMRMDILNKRIKNQIVMHFPEVVTKHLEDSNGGVHVNCADPKQISGLISHVPASWRSARWYEWNVIENWPRYSSGRDNGKKVFC